MRKCATTMGQETSALSARGANEPSGRRLSRYLRRGDADGSHDRPQTQEGMEAPTPGAHDRAFAGDHHLDDNPHIAQSDRLVRAHHPQPEQAPSTTETRQATTGDRASKADRVGSTAMAKPTKATADPAAETGEASSSSRQEETASSAMAQMQASTTTATPASSAVSAIYLYISISHVYLCSAQSLEQPRECVFDSAPAASTSTTTASTPVTTTTQSMEQLGERIFDPPSTTTSPSISSPTSPVPPVTTVESLQSALASSHAATPDSVAPTVAPTLSSSALPSLAPQQPLPSSSSSIPRPLPLGTTMIVQGLVQTIEVSRIQPRNVAPATHEEPNEETRPLLDKEASETNDMEPLASGSSPRRTSSPILNTSDSNTPDDDTSSDNSPVDSPTTSIDTSNTPNLNTRTRTPSPSSTDVLGLLLRFVCFLSSLRYSFPRSIAAQATAEALVPWSVPPRSRATPREGIASGLAAAFSALSGAGTGVTATNPTPAPIAVPEPPPPPPTLRPRPRTPPSVARTSPRRFSRLSLPSRLPSIASRRISALIPGRTSDSSRRVSTPLPPRQFPTSPQRTSSAPDRVLRRIERWLGRDSRSSAIEVDESVDFGRAPPWTALPVSVSAVPESSVSPLPSPPLVESGVQMPGPGPSTISIPAPSSISVPGPPSIAVPGPPSISVPAPSTIPVPTPATIPIPTPATIPAPTPATIPVPATPTTDAEDLIRFSQMLGFTPGTVHPPGTFERFLADMQDELRGALGEYQERVRSRVAEGGAGQGSSTGLEGGVGEEGVRDGDATGAVDGNAPGAGEAERFRLDHTRPHVPSTDPLPLNWWRMYQFPALPDGGASNPRPTSTSTPDETVSPTETTTSPTPAENDTETQQPIHPAIIIGLRSITRDPADETAPELEGDRVRDAESGDRARSDRVRSSESGDRVRGDRLRRRIRLGEEEERRRDGTRNYIIWIIGGYYPSNHPLLAHPNLFLGQVHPDELWMLNEFLGQVKPPTVSRDDIAKAGLRIVKGTEVKELAETKAVTENCTERCLICLDDYADDEDLRIMNCKHMFHKDCVDRWMETGRNNCPACRTKGVETTPAQESTPVS
ncbi:unnamed protein product [Rhizoctonia solani]|uniref:RING-type domain-containing protein n=1 Tax=Rhizoctonia solani TaxID=456999 RepID=A0A8H3HXB6_9AGAM|nr:unnamed protein product [Rhizoctonia solani]